VEGLMVSLLGGAVAVGIVWLSQQLLISGLSWNEATAAVMKGQSIFFRVRDLGIALLCAAALGAMSSFIAVNRLLQDFEP
jgi:ABC-type antimicrobial peptide transport system permease subunit